MSDHAITGFPCSGCADLVCRESGCKQRKPKDTPMSDKRDVEMADQIDPKDMETAEQVALSLPCRADLCSGSNKAWTAIIAQAIDAARQSGFRMGVEKAAEVVTKEPLFLEDVTYRAVIKRDERLAQSIRSLIPPSPTTEEGK